MSLRKFSSSWLGFIQGQIKWRYVSLVWSKELQKRSFQLIMLGVYWRSLYNNSPHLARLSDEVWASKYRQILTFSWLPSWNMKNGKTGESRKYGEWSGRQEKSFHQDGGQWDNRDLLIWQGSTKWTSAKVEHCMVFVHQEAPVLEASVFLCGEFFSVEQPFQLGIDSRSKLITVCLAKCYLFFSEDCLDSESLTRKLAEAKFLSCT